MSDTKQHKGQFTKGNPGRPKGAQNKSTETLRDRVAQLLDENYDQVLDDLDEQVLDLEIF